MVGRSMFENCLTTDIRDSLRGRANGWCEDAVGHRLARLIILVNAKDQDGASPASPDGYWHSGDRMSGSLSVSTQLISITRAQIRLEGESPMFPI